jgi:hypothetical protein
MLSLKVPLYVTLKKELEIEDVTLEPQEPMPLLSDTPKMEPKPE